LINIFPYNLEGLENNVNQRLTDNLKIVEDSLESYEKETSSHLNDLRTEISSLEVKIYDDQAKLADHLQKDLEDSNNKADKV